ncbi:MAG: DUF3006 domain-containing protein [Myxococcales bacterium]
MISDHDLPAGSQTTAGAGDDPAGRGTEKGSGNARTICLFVDEISDGVARVLVDEQVLVLALTFLPQGVREGDWVELRTRVIAAPPTETAARRKGLAADDPGGPIKL